MNWNAFTAIISLATLVIVVFGVVWTGGKLAQRVQDNAEDLEDQRKWLIKHDERHNGHDVKLGRLEEWKNGFNAAASVSGNLERKS